MKTIKLMADYECHALWHVDPHEYGDINPHDLAISKILADDLDLWAYEFDATLNMDDPASSGFKTEEDERAFKKRGALLADRLRAELGTEFSIEYHDK